jgi:hypothetical protein
MMKLLASVVRELFGWFVWLLLWLREIAGWICLVLGLLIFYQCYYFLVTTPPRIIRVIPLTFLGFVIFRAGIHLLKVSAAGLVCLRAQGQINETASAPGARRSGPAPRTRLRTEPFELEVAGQRR